MSTNPLVSTDWLAEHLTQTDVRVIDASWRLPGSEGIPAYQAFLERHIPGAVFFDIDDIAATNTDLPHMAPSPESFAQAMTRWQITPDDHVVVYDDVGLFSAARVWWTFRAMGHQSCYLLDGGLPKWLAQSRPTEQGKAQISAATKKPYQSTPVLEAIATDADIREALREGLSRQAIVLDARPQARFEGKTPEPRAGLRSGHMPGAINLPHTRLLTPEKQLRSVNELRTIFTEIFLSKGLSPTSIRSQDIITSCGSGVTAAVINLALVVAGYGPGRLYDGAWAQWGRADQDIDLFPVITSCEAGEG